MAANNLDIRITATENASGVFKAVGSAAETAGQSIERAGQSGKAGLSSLTSDVLRFKSEITDVGQSLAVFGGALTALFAVSAGKSIGLESAMANFNSLAGLSSGQLGQVTDQLRALSVEMGKSPTELAEGLYDIQSSGFEAADAMNILRASTVAGVAGLTSTATAAKAISGVLNAYSMDAEEAGNVSDVLFKTVESGVITFDQLANNLGSTTPLAAQLGVTIQELGAAYAELTLQNINAAQAETAIAALMRSSVQETTAMTEAVQAYGFASAEALIQSEGLAGFLTFLAEASGGTTAGLTELLGSAEATTAAMALMRNEGENFAATLADMESATQNGATTQDVFAVQAETTAFALQRLGAAFENVQVSFGNALAPLIGEAADAMTSLAMAFTSLPEPVQNTIGVLGAFGGVATLAAGSLLILVPKIAETVKAFQMLRASSIGTSFASMTSSIAPLAVALGGIIAIGGTIVSAWLTQKQAAAEYNSTLQDLNDTIFQLEQAGQGDFAERANQTKANLDTLKTAFESTEPAWEEFKKQFDDPADGFDAYNEAISTFQEGLKGLKADITQITSNIDEALSHPEIDATPYLDWIDRLSKQAASTATTLDDLAIAEMLANTTLEDYVGTTQSAVSASDKLAGSLGDVATAAESVGVAMTAAVKDEVSERMQNLTDAQTDFISNGDNILRFWLQYRQNVDDALSAQLDLVNMPTQQANVGEGIDISSVTAAAQAVNRGMSDLINSIGGVTEAASQMSFEQVVQLAEDADNAAEALDAVLRVFGQIDELGQRSSAAAGIADDLIGAVGELGALQDLWTRINEGTAEAALTQDQYNAAIQAGVSIQESNLRVQDDLTAMRAQQLPLLAQEQAAYEAQIEAISQLPALEQRRALALMDSNVQAQLATQYATAYQASIGEIPTEVATQMIVSAAEADPVIKDLLLQMGLIEEGANGTITVNFPDGPTVQDSIAQLTDAVYLLISVITGVPPLTVETNLPDVNDQVRQYVENMNDIDGTTVTSNLEANDNASAPVQNVLNNLALYDGSTGTADINANNADATAKLNDALSRIQGLDGQSATVHAFGINTDALGKISATRSALGNLNGNTALVTINAVDNATGVIGAVKGALASIPRSVTSTIKTVNVTEFQTIGRAVTGRALGGVVGSFAQGGIPIWAGENGPEVAHFAGGGTALLPHEGMYTVPPHTYISPSNAVGNTGGGDVYVSVNVAGSLIHERQLIGDVTREVATGLRNDLIRHYTANGVLT